MPTTKKVAKVAKPAVAKKQLVRPDQVIITKSHLSKLKNAALRAKTATDAPAPVNVSEILSKKYNGSASTQSYTPVFASEKGILAVRSLGSQDIRIRVILNDGVEALPSLSGWTQPSAFNKRHSVVTSYSNMAAKLNEAALALA